MLTDSANPDKIPHHVAFYPGVCSLPKYPPRVMWSIKISFVILLNFSIV